MNNIRINRRGPSEDGLILPDETKVSMEGIRYDTKLDPDTGEYISLTESGYAESKLPTINDLLKQGTVKKFSWLKEYTVRFSSNESDTLKNLPDTDFLTKHIPAIVKEFEEHGFTVTVPALMHNFGCWKRNFKSGYRCPKCHVFTPCRDNSLRFDASELDELCTEWQKTYFA